MTTTTQIKELEAAVKVARENEDQCRRDCSAATRDARQAEVALVQARAECLGFHIGSLVIMTVYNEKIIHGAIVGFSFEYGRAVVQVAPLTKAGKRHATHRHEAFWMDDRGCFSGGLRLEETGSDKADIERQITGDN
ncbi:hypothetical protein [Acidithiobacillus ferridurans]|uniref:Uncharacterized protein n=1 Tax=Acidithiobacillus ferridurans TaxID=1232575 RepID=A0A8X8K971_ACIFI|nr:hypothetical protein [Acidithiobacillus ferridurans]MBU2716960.1 hypothetical protein [Acidithiobacillus ferridurans]MBU2721807.1 hypothetical protein [Acidithiobacillus ferridurans]